MVRISLPGVVDWLVVRDPALVHELAQHPRLDRDYAARGRLVNRLVVGRLRRVLQLGGRPLPPVAPHGPARPTREQAALEARLDEALAAGLAGPEIDVLADYVRGAGSARKPGPLAQQAVGRLFSPTYEADAASWSDAEVLRAAPDNLNPLRGLYWALTGRVARARDRLALKVGRDPSGLHATGIAVHNLSDALRRMRRLYRDGRGCAPRSAEWAVGNALGAPRQVLRQPTCAVELACGRLAPDTLVILQLEAANAALPSAELVFMQGAWSRCPAHRWAPGLLAAVWRRARERAP
jgi:hypothetical protein